VEEWWEDWMREADRVLEDEELIGLVYEALGRRCAQSRVRGRRGTPAEVVLRLMILKHVRDWSFEALEREVRANLVYRRFTRIGGEKVPDEKTLARVMRALGPEVVEEINRRLVQMAQQQRVVKGRKMRLDTTVVETNIHYPTDSSLLGDRARVLTRTMKKIEGGVEGWKRRVRNRMRSVKKKVMAIALASRQKGLAGEERRRQEYRKLLRVTRQIVHQAERVQQEVKASPRRPRAALKPLAEKLQVMTERVQQLMRQTKARVMEGVTQSQEKIVSVFEPHTEIIRKGKANKPTEFGKLVKVQEAEHQIITHYEVYAERPSDGEVLVGAVQEQEERLGRTPELVAADAAFYTRENEEAVQALGVKRVSIPNRRTRSEERRRYEKRRWFRKGQKWRTGCEGRISVLKRRHGLNRCRYRGFAGMQRWVGLGVIADNLINIGRRLARPRASKS
jgi:transposase, IS5 family